MVHTNAEKGGTALNRSASVVSGTASLLCIVSLCVLHFVKYRAQANQTMYLCAHHMHGQGLYRDTMDYVVNILLTRSHKTIEMVVYNWIWVVGISMCDIRSRSLFCANFLESCKYSCAIFSHETRWTIAAGQIIRPIRIFKLIGLSRI